MYQPIEHNLLYVTCILDCIYFLLLWKYYVLKMLEKCCYGTFKKRPNHC